MKKKILFLSDWPDNIENIKMLQNLLNNEFSGDYEWTVWSCKKKKDNSLIYRWVSYFSGAFYVIRNRRAYHAVFIWQQMVGYILFEIMRIIRFNLPGIIFFTIISDSNFLFRYFKNHFIRISLKFSKAVIWPSEEMANNAKKNFPEFATRNHFTINPLFDVIDISVPVARELDDPYFRNGVFTAGKSERDFNVVIRAFRNTDIPVTIVCPDNYPITETDITPNIRILRFSKVSHEQYYALANQAFCIVISVTSDKSPCGQLNIGFAMANSKPIIATEGYAVKDFVVDNVNGILFRVGHSDEIRQGYEKLKNDPAFTKKLIGHANNTAKEMSPAIFIKKLIKIIEN